MQKINQKNELKYRTFEPGLTHAKPFFNRKKKLILIISLMLIILIIALFIFNLFKDSKDETKIKFDVEKETDDLLENRILYNYNPSIRTQIQLCKEINLSNECKGQSNEFSKGEDIYTEMRIFNLRALRKSDKFFLRYSIDKKLFGPDNELISEASGVLVDEEKEVPGKGVFSMNIIDNMISSESDKLGKYTIKLVIIDMNNGNEKKEEISFMLI